MQVLNDVLLTPYFLLKFTLNARKLKHKIKLELFVKQALSVRETVFESLKILRKWKCEYILIICINYGYLCHANIWCKFKIRKLVINFE